MPLESLLPLGNIKSLLDDKNASRGKIERNNAKRATLSARVAQFICFQEFQQ